MTDFLSQFFPPEPTAHAQQSIINIDTPLIEDDEMKKRQKLEDIALMTAYGENLTQYRQLEMGGEGVHRR